MSSNDPTGKQTEWRFAVFVVVCLIDVVVLIMVAMQMADGEVRINYLNMNDSWHRWIPSDSGQLAQPATKVRPRSFPSALT